MIVSVTSGVRGGVGKSVVSLLAAYLLNYLGEAALLVDAGGGCTKYLLDSPDPPYTRELPRTYDAIISYRVSIRREKGRFLRRKEVEEKSFDLYFTPEVRALTPGEVEALVQVVPELDDYFSYVILDLPAISGDHYWTLAELGDTRLIVVTPEKAVYDMVLSTERLGGNIIPVLNKFDKEIESHKEAQARLKEFFGDLIVVPYDPVLKVLSLRGVSILAYMNPEKETMSSFSELIYRLSSKLPRKEVRVRGRA
mgnify:CR=1 FL=1